MVDGVRGLGGDLGPAALLEVLDAAVVGEGAEVVERGAAAFDVGG